MMRQSSITLVALVAALAGSACGGSTPASPTPSPSTEPTAPTEPAAPAEATEASDPSAAAGSVDATLAARHWQLTEATSSDGTRLAEYFPDASRPITLDFAEGRVSVSNACNAMSGGYTLEAGRFATSGVIATRRACEEPLMRAEAAMSRALEAGGTLALEGDALLVWTLPTGEVLRFRGEPTAAARYGGPGEEVFLEVAPQRERCPHPLIPDHQCLKIRELHYDDHSVVTERGEWSFLYDEIEGYAHEAGTRNVLRVRRHTIANPPADGSSIAYVLDMVVESETVDQD